MGLLQKLKSALGLDASGSPAAGTSTRQDVDVTVEREPSTESEDAVKGTETAASDAQDDEPAVETEGETSTADEADADEAPTADEATADETSTADEATTDDAPTADEPVEPVVDSDAPVTEIKGIGPAYAERLENAGVSTVTDLAAADADELADATDLSPNRIAGWIEQAKSF